MDGITLDSAELALTILAEGLPGWTLSWHQNCGVWEVRNPNGRVSSSDRSPFDAVTRTLSKLNQAAVSATA